METNGEATVEAIRDTRTKIRDLTGDLATYASEIETLRKQVTTRDEYITAQQSKIEARDEAVDSLRAEIWGLKGEIEAALKVQEDYRKAHETAEAEVARLREQATSLVQENRHLKDNRQQWLDRDRDNQIVIQTLKDVISDLR